jgi:uncharacterized membrane-anchored protein
MFARIGRYVGGCLGALKDVAGSANGTVATFFSRCRQPMLLEHLPELDARYWLAILLASVLGTTFGDWCADGLGLGFISGLPTYFCIFLASLYAEKKMLRCNEAFYWIAMVITRASATNIADLMTHQLHLDYGAVGHWLGLALVLVALLPGRKPAANAQSLPTVDSRYWFGILIASVFGTVMGDFFSHLWGTGTAAALGLTILGIAFMIKSKAKLKMELFYWMILALERTVGTSTGDWFAGKHGLDLGKGTVSVITAILMTVFLLSFKQGTFVLVERLRRFLAPAKPDNSFDQRFWLFAVLATAAACQFIQWGYTYLSAPASTAIVGYINPYLYGLFVIPNNWMYYSWLVPEVALVFAVVAVAQRWVTSAYARGFFYWAAYCLIAAMGGGMAAFLKYTCGNQSAVYIAAVCVPVLLYLASTGYSLKDRRFARGVLDKGVSLGHCGLLFIAILLGTTVGDQLSTFLAQGYKTDTVIFVAALWVVLQYRSGLKTDTRWHEIVTVFSCVMTALTGFQLGELVESQLPYGTQDSQWWTAVLGPAAIFVIAWFWRQGTPWQAIVAVAKTQAVNAIRWAIAYRRLLVGVAIVGGGLALVNYGEQVVTLRPPQETLYNQGMTSLRNDLANATSWGAFVHPEEELFQQSLMQYEHQRQAGLIGRLLYGEPDTALASQANLKIGVILLLNAKDDTKLLNEASMYLKLAVKMNPGVPYAHDLLDHISGSTAAIDRLALMALAPERDLELLYKHNPQYRSKQPQKSKDGQGDPNDKQGDQQGQPDQPNDQDGKPNDQKNDQQGQASKNTTLRQNMQDVKNGTANDGI